MSLGKIITDYQINKRAYWINEITKLSGDFGADSTKVEEEINEEVEKDGLESLIGHLRLCGAIPESYKHDSSEEKLYSKYTDVVLSKSFESLGLRSAVLTERADVADVECVAPDYSFVADAKAFRLSRTAKNQKDFKVQAMDNWKHGKPYAMVVCPIYQLPTRQSQIYKQAIDRSVCVFSYTHLAVLVRHASIKGEEVAIPLLHSIFDEVNLINPSKDASVYWRALNSLMLHQGSEMANLWNEEKIASSESIEQAKNEALQYLASERQRIMSLSKEDAIQEVLKTQKLDNKVDKIKSVTENELLNVG